MLWSEAAVVFSHAAHFLGEAAVFKEILLQSFELPEQQVIGLMNEDDGHVGNGFGRTCGTELHEIIGIVMLPS